MYFIAASPSHALFEDDFPIAKAGHSQFHRLRLDDEYLGIKQSISNHQRPEKRKETEAKWVVGICFQRSRLIGFIEYLSLMDFYPYPFTPLLRSLTIHTFGVGTFISPYTFNVFNKNPPTIGPQREKNH